MNRALNEGKRHGEDTDSRQISIDPTKDKDAYTDPRQRDGDPKQTNTWI